MSMSKKVEHLNLSENTLQAWGIRSSDHLVLLVCFSGKYISFKKVCDRPVIETKKCLEFRVGRFTSYRPSTFASNLTFQIPKRHEDQDQSWRSEDPQEHDFEPIFLSPSLSHFMNHDFVSVVKIRY